MQEFEAEPSNGGSLLSSSHSQQATVDVTLELPRSDAEDALERLKTEFQGLLSEAQLLAKNSTSCDMMKAGITHLKHAVNTMKAIEPAIATETLVPAVSIAPNKKSEHQPRFHQTGKKRASDRNQSLSKPTLPEIDQCLQSLTHETVRVCGACFQEENKGSSSEFVKWIQCTKCSIWLHATCTNHQPMVTSDSPSTRIANDFICIYCSEV